VIQDSCKFLREIFVKRGIQIFAVARSLVEKLYFPKIFFLGAGKKRWVRWFA